MIIINRYYLSTYSQNLSFIYNKSINFAAEIKITNKKTMEKMTMKKMTMETRKEIAAEKKRCGSHNCTQAVLCTYHDFTGMDEETIKNAFMYIYRKTAGASCPCSSQRIWSMRTCGL